MFWKLHISSIKLLKIFSADSKGRVSVLKYLLNWVDINRQRFGAFGLRVYYNAQCEHKHSLISN